MSDFDKALNDGLKIFGGGNSPAKMKEMIRQLGPGNGLNEEDMDFLTNEIDFVEAQKNKSA